MNDLARKTYEESTDDTEESTEDEEGTDEQAGRAGRNLPNREGSGFGLDVTFKTPENANEITVFDFGRRSMLVGLQILLGTNYADAKVIRTIEKAWNSDDMKVKCQCFLCRSDFLDVEMVCQALGRRYLDIKVSTALNPQSCHVEGGLTRNACRYAIMSTSPHKMIYMPSSR